MLKATPRGPPLHSQCASYTAIQWECVLCSRQLGQQVVRQRARQPCPLPLLLVEVAQLLDGACQAACMQDMPSNSVVLMQTCFDERTHELRMRDLALQPRGVPPGLDPRPYQVLGRLSFPPHLVGMLYDQLLPHLFIRPF